ncbi:MAG: outer membrane channel protein TolC, partial [Candidatus Regiella insecticola]|nr:outer membrane channel protein TolC [Candidatus Regiella insecticola]
QLKIKSALGVLNPGDLIAFNEILDTPIATSSLVLTTEEIAPTSNQKDIPTDLAPMFIHTVPKNGG